MSTIWVAMATYYDDEEVRYVALALTREGASKALITILDEVCHDLDPEADPTSFREGFLIEDPVEVPVHQE